MAGATRDFRAIFDNLIQMGAVIHGLKAGKERYRGVKKVWGAERVQGSKTDFLDFLDTEFSEYCCETSWRGRVPKGTHIVGAFIPATAGCEQPLQLATDGRLPKGRPRQASLEIFIAPCR